MVDVAALGEQVRGEVLTSGGEGYDDAGGCTTRCTIGVPS